MADNSTPTNDLTGDWQAIPLTGPPYPADRIPPDKYFGYRPGTFYSQPLWKQGLDYASVPVREIWGGLRGTAQAVYDVGHAIAYPRPPQFYAAPDSANLLQDPYLQHQATQAILGIGMLGAPFGEVEGIPAFPAWHGSPYRFEPVAEAEAGPYGPQPAPYGVFDPSKMGTGEGTQYEGWGFYSGGARRTGEYYRDLRPNIAAPALKIYLDGQPIDTKALGKRVQPSSVADMSHPPYGHVADPQDLALHAFYHHQGSLYNAEDYLRTFGINNSKVLADPTLFNASLSTYGPDADPQAFRSFLWDLQNSYDEGLDWLTDNRDRLDTSNNIVRLDGNYINTHELAKKVYPARNLSHDPFGNVVDPKDLAVEIYTENKGDIPATRDELFNNLQDATSAKNKTPEQRERTVKSYFTDWDNMSDDYKDTMLQHYDDYLDKNFDSYSKAYDWLNDNGHKLTYGDQLSGISPSLYQIWIHPGHDDMLLTNREWHLQPPKVQEAIRKNLPDLAKEMDDRYTTDPNHIYGRDMYSRLVQMTGSPKGASEALDKAGVPALRFRDRNSRFKYTDVPTLDGKRLGEMPLADQDTRDKFADLARWMRAQPQQIRLSDLNTRLNDLSNTLRGGSDQDRVLRDWLYNNWHRIGLGDHPDSSYNYVIFNPRSVSMIDRQGQRYGLDLVDRNPFTGELWTYK